VLLAPGKLVVLNIASAGSPVAMPRVRVGTNCWFLSHTSPRVTEPPKLMLWFPFIQLNVSSRTFVDPSR
jgi:hypothetical protein